MPGLVLWAWQRPEDLSFVDSRATGIAFLAETIRIDGDGAVEVFPRTNRLTLPPEAALEATVRIELPAGPVRPHPATVVDALERAAGLPGIRALQIDFDARQSRREFYREVLADLRKHIAIPISLTALASWCEGDRWFDSQLTAEAVPMLFRLGSRESRDAAITSDVCRPAIGLSMDEPWPARRPAAVERVYLFSPRAWTPADYQAALLRLENWQ